MYELWKKLRKYPSGSTVSVSVEEMKLIGNIASLFRPSEGQWCIYPTLATDAAPIPAEQSKL